MIMADMYSRMCFVRKMPSSGATAAAVISRKKEIFAEHGVPDILQSDNGPQYASTAFLEFTALWGFEHITSKPHFPASNGFAESMVMKTAFTKAKYSGEDPQLALFTFHNTPVDAHLPSPAQPRLPTQPGNTDPCAEDNQGRLSEKAY